MSKKPLPQDKKDECLRLKAIFNSKKNELGLTQEKLAHALEMNQSSVSHYLNGVNPLNSSVAASFASILKVDVREFSERLADEMAKIAQAIGSSSAKESNVIAIDSRRKAPDSNFITIPHLDIVGSMGSGRTPPEHHIEVIRDMTVHLDWLKTQGLSYSNPENLAIIDGDGDSMEGTFRNGDSLLVDRGITEIRTDAVYVFTLDGDLFIKRLQRMTGGSLRMISDNPVYPAIMIEGAQLDRVHIQARVLLVWNARKL
ncbi:helix-turn-helix domain-containing protein [Pseudomonas sp. FW306-02-F02-AA]|uniref:LexA family transcriptional regulator n=1 Tax=Pseudomonas TaxID=286 RepID=UPI0009C10A00|nr:MULTISPECIES: LexA family transcriptional regulator [Pseudomonas]PMZ03884.1 helix-turn-helix domain-containing protein [Pseudomonas sp. FW306-02-F02-AB]PMZ08249.1 helix-turn-helix domain-containing protein [Pseudomonas sp. FW306-02-H06C]PMZ13989.1 helix-turn-helix domain-containing protein [Pseudomonas sp. FW306-02-F02-AA]PMZ21502.1 helix-turn-helix domain-containing protein [Pseudomonas sp. FW306-02-F08-AA]PMZ25772.1 helix-turn-helix domain-containing protein [Pseudomonas sp. FW306-02-F04-